MTNEIPERAMTQWVKCEDRLPENDSEHRWNKKEVLVCTQSKDIKVAWIDSFGMENKPIWSYSYCCGCHVEEEVTHWADLPQPPESK